MINILITYSPGLTDPNHLGYTVDVTPDILEQDDVITNDEYEWQNFIRVVPDCILSLSNMNGVYTTLFANRPPTAFWTVKITDNERITFIGKIRQGLNTIIFYPNDESVRVTAFSVMKEFWDRCKVFSITPNPLPLSGESDMAYVTVSYILKRELRGFDDLFKNIVINPDYANRQIRAWQNAANAPDPTISDNGRYAELVGSIYQSGDVSDKAPPPTIYPRELITTVYVLLIAFATYYNAEFSIDYNTNSLVMSHRLSIVNAMPSNGAPHDLNSVLMDSKEDIEAHIEYSQVYDFIKVAYFLSPPQVLQLASLSPILDKSSVVLPVSYVITEVRLINPNSLIYQNVEVETACSKILTIAKPKPDPSSPLPNPLSYNITLLIPPPTQSDVIGFNIYRSKVGGGNLYFVARIDLLTPTYTDSINDLFLSPKIAPSKFNAAGAWLSFTDRGFGPTWNAPIFDNADGVNTPAGNTLNLIPALNFRSIGSSNVLPQNATDIAAFFGGEAANPDYAATAKKDYQTLFVNHRLIICNVEGTIYLSGDAAMLSKLLQPFMTNSYVVKKAQQHLLKEYSQLQLMSL